MLDEMEDKLLSADEAIAMATEHLRAVARDENTKQPGTRPADIKRYLKPLLEQRSDLVLIGRYLLIRPVRHMLRGAFGRSGRAVGWGRSGRAFRSSDFCRAPHNATWAGIEFRVVRKGPAQRTSAAGQAPGR
jgi:hypothetical protein